MAKVLKFWAGLGLAAVSGTLVADAASLNFRPAQNHSTLLQLADAAGEAGESGAGVKAADDQPDFIAALGLVEGHMRAGIALHKSAQDKSAEADAALVHLKHPADELYVSLKPMLEARKAKGFAAELEAVSAAISAKATPAEVDALFEKMKIAVAASRGEGEAVSAHAMSTAVLILLRTAAAEYAIGVVDGKVKDAKEYQDAWGFVQTAKSIMADISKLEREEHPEPLAEIDAELAKLGGLWPDLAGAKPISADPRLLAVAAAKVELAGLAIK
jgi:hypothetical protein